MVLPVYNKPMFLQRIETPRLKKDGTLSERPSVTYQFKCDTCEKVYEKRPGNVSVSKTGTHFCSNKCKFESHRPGGELRQSSEKTSIERYGTAKPMLSTEVKERQTRTLMERYGKEVSSPLHVPGAKEKRQRTHLERYGHEHTFQIETFRQKRNVTWQRNMPKNFISKAELKLRTLLETRYGVSNVIHQKWVNGHPIDFYVRSIDTYVQLDGVYWHGLDRPIDEIAESDSARDASIYQKWLSDRQQDAWFIEHNMRLVRITDVQLSSGSCCLSELACASPGHTVHC